MPHREKRAALWYYSHKLFYFNKVVKIQITNYKYQINSKSQFKKFNRLNFGH